VRQMAHDGAKTAVTSTVGLPTLTIEARRRLPHLDLAELFRYRELLYFLTWRDIKVRYKQTVLGAAWAILQPFLTMLAFVMIGGLANIPTEGVPRPLFYYTALVPWTFFANGLTLSASSLVGGANLITKVYFPRLTMPIAAILAGILDFALAFLLLLGMVVFFGVSPSRNLLWLPVFAVLAFVASLGIGLWLSAMNVQFRDVRYVVPFLVQLGLFFTPVLYPSNLISSDWLPLYSLNPMVGVVDGFRWALLGVGQDPGASLLVSSAAALVLLASGWLYFRQMEDGFADLV
jgi:lipopolysaccharide transport system permease protein